MTDPTATPAPAPDVGEDDVVVQMTNLAVEFATWYHRALAADGTDAYDDCITRRNEVWEAIRAYTRRLAAPAPATGEVEVEDVVDERDAKPWAIPKDDDEWGNGKTFAEMRRLCPDPALGAAERNDPVGLAAIAAGLVGWDAWEVYDGRFYDPDTYLTVTPGPESFEIAWDGCAEDRGEAVAVLQRFAAALARPATLVVPEGSWMAAVGDMGVEPSMEGMFAECERRGWLVRGGNLDTSTVAMGGERYVFRVQTYDGRAGYSGSGHDPAEALSGALLKAIREHVPLDIYAAACRLQEQGLDWGAAVTAARSTRDAS